MILPVADRTMDVTSKRAASSTAIGSSCETLAARAAAVVSSRRMGLIFSAGEEWRHGRQAIRPLDTGSRQHRQSRARQCLHQRSAPGDLLLHHRPRPHPRSLPQYRRRQHVGQCRHEPIPFADRAARRAARRYRAGRAGPHRAARAPDADAQAAGRNEIRLPRKQRLRRDRLPLGQPHQRSCARRDPLRPHRAGDALHRVRRSSRHGGPHRAFLSRRHGRARDRDRERRRPQSPRASGREAILVLPRDRRAREAL